MTRVAYLGPKGTFSEEAAHHYFEDKEMEWFMFDTILDVLEAVNDN